MKINKIIFFVLILIILSNLIQATTEQLNMMAGKKSINLKDPRIYTIYSEKTIDNIEIFRLRESTKWVSAYDSTTKKYRLTRPATSGSEELNICGLSNIVHANINNMKYCDPIIVAGSYGINVRKKIGKTEWGNEAGTVHIDFSRDSRNKLANYVVEFLGVGAHLICNYTDRLNPAQQGTMWNQRECDIMDITQPGQSVPATFKLNAGKNIIFAWFKANSPQTYIFSYNSKKYIFNVEKNTNIYFDPTGNKKIAINGVGTITVDNQILINAVKEKEANYIFDDFGNIIRINFPPGSFFVDNKYSIKVTSSESFSVCFGTEQCKDKEGKLIPNSFVISYNEVTSDNGKSALNRIRSFGKIDYSIGMTNIISSGPNGADTVFEMFPSLEWLENPKGNPFPDYTLKVTRGSIEFEKDYITGTVNSVDCKTQSNGDDVKINRKSWSKLTTENLYILDHCDKKIYVINPIGGFGSWDCASAISNSKKNPKPDSCFEAVIGTIPDKAWGEFRAKDTSGYGSYLESSTSKDTQLRAIFETIIMDIDRFKEGLINAKGLGWVDVVIENYILLDKNAFNYWILTPIKIDTTATPYGTRLNAVDFLEKYKTLVLGRVVNKMDIGQSFEDAAKSEGWSTEQINLWNSLVDSSGNLQPTNIIGLSNNINKKLISSDGKNINPDIMKNKFLGTFMLNQAEYFAKNALMYQYSKYYINLGSINIKDNGEESVYHKMIKNNDFYIYAGCKGIDIQNQPDLVLIKTCESLGGKYTGYKRQQNNPSLLSFTKVQTIINELLNPLNYVNLIIPIKGSLVNNCNKPITIDSMNQFKVQTLLPEVCGEALRVSNIYQAESKTSNNMFNQIEKTMMEIRENQAKIDLKVFVQQSVTLLDLLPIGYLTEQIQITRAQIKVANKVKRMETLRRLEQENLKRLRNLKKENKMLESLFAEDNIEGAVKNAENNIGKRGVNAKLQATNMAGNCNCYGGSKILDSTGCP